MRVILDTDPGNGIAGADIDDGLALGLGLRSPEIELEAVTVVAGNVPVDRGVDCALEILEIAGARDVPVHRGAARPLTTDPGAFRRALDGRREEERARELWADVTATASGLRPDPQPAAEALVERVTAAPGEITVLAVGPLTNVAAAMALDPAFERDVARIVVMGGAFDVPNALQELNFSYDPEAADAVLRGTADVLVVPLDVTLQTFMRLDDVDRLAAAGTPLSDYLATTVRPWVQWLGERFGRDGCALHDPLAMAALIDPEVIRTRTACAAMELTGTLTRGRSVAWDPTDEEALHGDLVVPDIRPVQIACAVDNDRFMPLLLERLSK